MHKAVLFLAIILVIASPFASANGLTPPWTSGDPEKTLLDENQNSPQGESFSLADVTVHFGQIDGFDHWVFKDSEANVVGYVRINDRSLSDAERQVLYEAFCGRNGSPPVTVTLECRRYSSDGGATYGPWLVAEFSD